jgi:5'-nucleotidase
VRTITLTDGTKIVENGAVVAGAPNLTVVSNKFTAEGGDNYVMLKTLRLVNLGISYEESLVAYLKSFPANSSGVPTVPVTDVRYAQQTGEGRFTWVD